MSTNPDLLQAVSILRAGGLVAYPTESVFGLGCDPFNAQAVARLLTLKKRTAEKGLILITHALSEVKALIEDLPALDWKRIEDSWPGRTTWVFPAGARVPAWIRGQYQTVAFRIPGHPIARELCECYGQPLVSTSLNWSGEPPLKALEEIKAVFGDHLDWVVSGTVLGYANPSEIRNAQTGAVLRKG